MPHMDTHIYITSALLSFFSFTLLPLFLAGRLAQTLPFWHKCILTLAFKCVLYLRSSSRSIVDPALLWTRTRPEVLPLSEPAANWFSFCLPAVQKAGYPVFQSLARRVPWLPPFSVLPVDALSRTLPDAYERKLCHNCLAPCLDWRMENIGFVYPACLWW
jgi:hypothetical protein